MCKFLGNFSLNSEPITEWNTKKIVLISGSSLSKGNLDPKMSYVFKEMSDTEKDLQNYVGSKNKKAEVIDVLLLARRVETSH